MRSVYKAVIQKVDILSQGVFHLGSTTYPDGKSVSTTTNYSFTDKPTLIQKIIRG